MNEAELIGMILNAVDGLVALAIALYYNRDLRQSRDRLLTYILDESNDGDEGND